MHLKVPTTLSEEGNLNFRMMYKNHFGFELTVEEANEEAIRLMGFIALIIESRPKFWKEPSQDSQ